MNNLQTLQQETLNLLNVDVLTREDINAIDYRITPKEEEGMVLGSIHICINQTEVRIYRVLKANENPKTVAQEIHDEIIKRLDKRAWNKIRRSLY